VTDVDETRVLPSAETNPVGRLRGPGFDAAFIGGTAALGLVSAGIVIARPSLWQPILLADLWLLGYHHVISTYSRLLMDAESRRINRALITWLPIVVVLLVGIAGYGIGAWTLATIYFYWQWWHYTRQSWGVSRVYENKAGLEQSTENPRLAQAVFYLVPAWGILWRSAQGHDEFLGLPVKMLPVPVAAANAVGVIACVGLIWLVSQRLRAWRQGRLPLAHTLYLGVHYTMFVVSYRLIDSLDFGWLGLNIWHNAQYVLFVWYFNNRRFASGSNGEARALSWLSQSRRFVAYIAVSIALSSVVYLAIQQTIALVVAPLIVFQAINFHHYVVDSLIWKVRKPALQQTLGLPGATAKVDTSG